jgi:hypothetical protein
LRVFFDVAAQCPAPFQVAAADQVGKLFRVVAEPVLGFPERLKKEAARRGK